MNYKSFLPVILSGGKVDRTLIPIVGEITTGLIPINKKPVIFYVIEQCMEMGFDKVAITVGFQGEKLKKIVSSFYGNKMKIYYVDVDYTKKPGNSIIKVVKDLNVDNILVILADTIVNNLGNLLLDYHGMDSCVLVGEIEDKLFSNFWSKAKIKNGEIVNVYEKDDEVEEALPICGVYLFKSIREFEQIFQKIESKDVEISDIIKLYLRKNMKVAALKTKEWIDVGHIFTYYNAKTKMIQSRYFNHFIYNEDAGTIKKFSENVEKLRDEILWYLHIPQQLKAFIPKIIDYSIDGELFIEMEYYGYPTLSELFVYGDLTEDIWLLVLKRIFSIIETFKKYKGAVSYDEYKIMYIFKTLKRVENAIKDNPLLKQLFSYDFLVINGRKLKGWKYFSDKLEERVKFLYNPEDNTIIHGDLCFSNILFDLNTGIIRLIDPRGRFGKNIIYGDIKYDLAKLSHSILGKYDYIINDLFEYSLNTNEINFKFLVDINHDNHDMENSFKNLLVNAGYKIEDIRFIEALLFISMLPLHKDRADRQILMFSKGLELLNDFFEI